MSINADRIVSIVPRVIGAGSTGLETIGNVLTKNPLISTSNIAIRFASADSVGAMFGYESNEYKFAAQYFTGYTNMMKAVRALVISRRVDTACAAWVRGKKISAALADFKAVTAGAVTITVNGTESAATDIDLSAATSLSNVAEIVATAIGGVTGAYDSNLGAFIFTTSATGANATIGFAADSTLSAMLGIRETDGAILSQGSDAMSVAANMEAIAAVTQNWVGLTTLYAADNSEHKALAAWTDINDDYCYFAWSTDARCGNTETYEASPLGGLDEYNTVATLPLGDQQDAAFAMAIGAAIDWEREQGMVTWFGKTTTGLSPRVHTNQLSEILDSVRGNYIGDFAARNDEFKFLNRGYLTGKFYGFIDVLYGMIWLKARLQVSILNGLTSVNRAPYNERGYGLVEAWIADPMNAALRNGVCDTGLLLSESQRVQIMGEVGEDITPNLYANGYWYRVEDPDPANRTDRDTPTIYIYYTYAGSIQRISAPLTAVI